MKAIELSRFGGPEVLQVVERETPVPGPGELRIRVMAAALNHLDLWVRRGHPGIRIDLPFTPGSDFAGIVDAVGDGPSRFKESEEVVIYPASFCGRCEDCRAGRQNFCREYHIFGENRSGGMSEYTIVPESCVFPRPKNLSWQECAAFPLSWLTSWHMLMEKVEHRPGDWILIQAAASGTGIAALQIAKMHGLRVIASAGSDAKCRALEGMGVEHCINYSSEDLIVVVKNITGKKGVQIVMDHVGEKTFAQSMAVLARKGQYVTCGGSSGPRLCFDVRHLFIKHQRIIGSTMGTVPDFVAVLKGIESGGLKPVIHRVFPPEEIAAAHRELEDRRVIGKVVISFAPDTTG